MPASAVRTPGDLGRGVVDRGLDEKTAGHDGGAENQRGDDDQYAGSFTQDFFLLDSQAV